MKQNTYCKSETEHTGRSIWKHEILMIVSVVILVAILVSCIRMIAKCETDDMAGNAENEYFDSFEKTYLSDVRNALSDDGYHNSGITMTSVSDESGRHYLVEIHNDSFARMDQAEIGEVESRLERFEFGDASDDTQTDFSYTLY